MSNATASRSSAVREQFDHPVIDVDGHMLEFFPALFDYVKEVGGPEIRDRVLDRFRHQNSFSWYQMSVEERRRYGQIRARRSGPRRLRTRSIAPPRCCHS
jgi:hypothetical protein